MMSEKPKSGTGLSGITNKQKMMVGIFVIILVIVLWQVIELFGGGGGASAPSPSPAAPVPGTKVSAVVPGGGSNTSSQAAPSSQTSSTGQINEAVVPKENEFFKLQEDAQQKYVISLNELQTLRIQKEIEETHQAIASAKLATVTAEKSIADLLTKPVVPTLSPAAYGSALVSPVQSGQPGAAQSQSNVVMSPPVETEPQYVVISVSMQFNSWSAVVGYQGKPYQVTVGSILPADSSEVVSIDNSGVVLEKGKKRRKISIVPSI